MPDSQPKPFTQTPEPAFKPISSIPPPPAGLSAACGWPAHCLAYLEGGSAPMAMSNLPAAPFGRTRFMDMAPGHADFTAAVIDGLSRPQKALPGTFFHDETGSALFDRMCEQPECYPARAELAILERAGAPNRRPAGPWRATGGTGQRGIPQGSLPAGPAGQSALLCRD